MAKTLEDHIQDEDMPKATGKEKEAMMKKADALTDKMQKQYQEAYKKSKPSSLSKLLGLGLGAAAVYFGGPLLASFGPTASVASTISSYLGVASQYVSYGLAALSGGALGYSIPTSMSRAANASKYMQQSMAKDNKGPATSPAKP